MRRHSVESSAHERRNRWRYSPYWNPKNETLPREELQRAATGQAAAHVRVGLCEQPLPPRALGRGGLPSRPAQDAGRPAPHPLHDPRGVDGVASWNKPLFGDLPATDPDNAIRYHLTSGTSGRTPIRVLDSMKDWEWIAEMWCYGLWGFGMRPGGYGLLRLRLRLVHRLLGRALRLREDRRARHARRRADHRGARQADRRDGRHHRLPPRRPTRCGCGRRPRRWASTSPKTARWTSSSSPASRPARSPPSSASSKRPGARSAATPRA